MESPDDRSWSLVVEGFDPHAERGVEAAFAVTTANFGVRAALEEGSTASHPLLIVAGCFMPFAGAARETLCVLADPAGLAIWVDDARVRMADVVTLEHVRTLDLRHARVDRRWTFELAGRRWQIVTARLADAAEPDRYAHRLSLRLVAGSRADVRVRFSEEAGHGSEGIAGAPHGATASAITSRRLLGAWSVEGPSASATIDAGEEVSAESVSLIGRESAPQGPPPDFDEIAKAHAGAWGRRWRDASIDVSGHDALRAALRFALYHVLSGAPVNGGRWSLGARNLSGEAYHGHVFWDTEIFVLPVLALTHPEAARSALLYRYRTLDAARERARSFGYDGALYAWESTDTGHDCTPASAVLPDGTHLRILTGEQEHHISSAIPYAVMQYWRATGDDPFIADFGAEIMFECARFWASRVTPTDDSYSIRRVIGPDEYHVGVDDNAYTNAMAAWTLRASAQLARRMSEGRTRAEALASPSEADAWDSTAARIVRSTFHTAELVEQFDGFFGLRDIDVGSYRRAGIPVDVAVGPIAIQQFRAVKQADVLMSAALLPDHWSEAALRLNCSYYEPLTAHSSSLSPPIHALVAAWLRDGRRCMDYIEETCAIDMAAGFRGAAGGVHLAALGGLWQAVVFGLAGFKFSPDRIAFDPYLPEPLDQLSFSIRWRGRSVSVTIVRSGEVTVQHDGPPTVVRVNHDVRTIEQDAPAVFRFAPTVTYWSVAD